MIPKIDHALWLLFFIPIGTPALKARHHEKGSSFAVCHPLTWADYRGHLPRWTWRCTQSSYRTISHVLLSPSAVKHVPPDLITSFPKMRPSWGRKGNSTFELLAENVGIFHVPVRVAEGSPVPKYLELHSSLTSGLAIHQADFCVSWKEIGLLKRCLQLPNPTLFTVWEQFEHVFWVSLEQTTPTSLLWLQVPSGREATEQSERWDSCPSHWNSSAQICPLPSPKWAPPRMEMTVPHCNSVHSTLAASREKSESQTVPHLSPCFTSTRPEQGTSPPMSLGSLWAEKWYYFSEKWHDSQIFPSWWEWRGEAGVFNDFPYLFPLAFLPGVGDGKF